MILSLIAAMDENRVIGRNNRMPWRLPEDRKRFHAVTGGHCVVMGRMTYESIGRPLPGRKNVVITRRRDFAPEGVAVVADLDEALQACPRNDEVFVLGGEQIFREAIQRADRIYLTLVHTRGIGDAFFPDVPAEFIEVQREEAADTYPTTYIRYEQRGAVR